MPARYRQLAIAATALLPLFSLVSHGATLVSAETIIAGLGPGTDASASFVTGAENNDSAGGAASGKRDLRNTLDIDASAGPIAGSPAYIDLVFTVESVFDAVTGITEYAVTQALLNNSSAALGSVRYQLGFGTGPDFLENLSTPGDGLSFDQELEGLDKPLPSSDVFTFCETCSNSDQVVLQDGALRTDATAGIEFQLDIPDLFFDDDGFNIPADFLLGPDESTGFAGGYSFTLRQTPALVPVPAAAWLFGSALGLLAFSNRRGLPASR